MLSTSHTKPSQSAVLYHHLKKCESSDNICIHVASRNFKILNVVWKMWMQICSTELHGIS